jgi:hypothetical protein
MRWHLSVTLALAIVATAVSPTPTSLAADDHEKKAAELLRDAKTLDDIKRVVRENPGNPVLVLVGITIPAAEETGRRLRQLFAQIEDKDVPKLEELGKGDLALLRRSEAALQRTKANVLAAGRWLDQIYADQVTKLWETARKVMNERETREFVTGLNKKRQAEVAAVRRFLAAHAELYEAMHEQVLFLISANGRYSFNPRVRAAVFQNKDDLAKYNKSIERIVAAAQEYERLQQEVAQVSQYTPPRIP